MLHCPNLSHVHIALFIWLIHISNNKLIISKLSNCQINPFTRQVSSMIHSARPTLPPVANIVFAWNLLCFEKWGRTDRRTDGRTTWTKTVITNGRDCGLAGLINNMYFYPPGPSQIVVHYFTHVSPPNKLKLQC